MDTWALKRADKVQFGKWYHREWKALSQGLQEAGYSRGTSPGPQCSILEQGRT